MTWDELMTEQRVRLKNTGNVVFLNHFSKDAIIPRGKQYFVVTVSKEKPTLTQYRATCAIQKTLENVVLFDHFFKNAIIP